MGWVEAASTVVVFTVECAGNLGQCKLCRKSDETGVSCRVFILISSGTARSFGADHSRPELVRLCCHRRGQGGWRR